MRWQILDIHYFHQVENTILSRRKISRPSSYAVTPWNVLWKKETYNFISFAVQIWTFLKQNVKINVLEMHRNMSPNFSWVYTTSNNSTILLHTRLVMGYLQLYIVCIERSSHFPNEDFFQYYFRSCTWLRVWITKFFLWLTLSTKELSSCGEIDMGRVVVTGGGGKIAHYTFCDK